MNVKGFDSMGKTEVPKSDVVKEILNKDGDPYLYEILNGKFARKDHEGSQGLLEAGARFVPTPSELNADRYRLRRTDLVVEWDSDEATAALFNVNMRDPMCRGFIPEGYEQLTPEGQASASSPGEAATLAGAAAVAVRRRAAKSQAPSTT